MRLVMMAAKALVYTAVPLVVIGGAILGEVFLLDDRRVYITLNGQLNDVLKQTIELESSLSSLITGLATGVIGGVAYYFRARKTEFDAAPRRTTVLMLLVLFSACLSVFFGQLWMAALRDQLAHDYVDFFASSVLWPERLQSGSFLAALVWFAFTTVQMESLRRGQGSLIAAPTESEIRQYANHTEPAPESISSARPSSRARPR